MPIYDYACEHCGHMWEAHVLRLEDFPFTCPKCKDKDIKQLVSFKGRFAGEHKKKWDRPPPSDPVSVYINRDPKKGK